MARPRKTPANVEPEVLETYKCVMCGHEYKNPEGAFYRTTSKMYAANNGYYPVCCSCLNMKLEEYTNRYGENIAVMLICHYLDVPFYYGIYDKIIRKNDGFTIGMYTRQMNQQQYRGRSFINTLVDKKELGITEKKYEDIKESKWTISENRNKKNVIDIVGYDPFEGYDEEQRKFLFSNIIGYLEEDGIEDDQFKISQIIQLVNNNYQIMRLDMSIAKLDPNINSADIKILNDLKRNLVNNNDKIAKENGVSVKNRMDKQAGRSTLTYLMKHMRELNIPKAEANYYDQLKSEGSQWAANMSMKAIKENGFFDENDYKDIMENQYDMIQELQSKLDDVQEENRLLLIENDELKAGDKNG